MIGQLRKIKILVILVLVLSLAGCEFNLPGEMPEQIPDAAFTQAAQTIIAQLTQNSSPKTTKSVHQVTARPASPTSTTTEETLPPTSTPAPTDTPFPIIIILPTETTSTEITPTPVLSPSPSTQNEPPYVLAFQDNFSSAHFWPVTEEINIEMYYTAGGYAISNDVDREIAWSVRGEQYGDVRVEVTGSREEGPMDGYFGVICHFTDVGHYYLFAVSSDGWYGIAVKRPGNLFFIDEGRDTTVILTGNAPNVIRGDCSRGSLTLWANGTRLLQVADSTYSAGAVGMAVGTRTEDRYVVIFDDFSVYVPE